MNLYKFNDHKDYENHKNYKPGEGYKELGYDKGQAYCGKYEVHKSLEDNKKNGHEGNNASEYYKNYAGERYYTLNQYLKKRFGQKVYKLALDGGMSCPNRDGTLGHGGCIFCSAGGSGEFAIKAAGRENGDDSGTLKIIPGSVTAQIEQAKAKICQKTNAALFIAYFQSYTNTYASVEYLRQIFTEAISHPQVAVLSIATRPDCLPPEVIQLLKELNQIKPVWIELGLQTIHERTAQYIRRGYQLSCYENAIKQLRKAGIEVITHVILGLPGESKEDMTETIRYLARKAEEPWGSENTQNQSLMQAAESRENKDDTKTFIPPAAAYMTQGIKLQLLHVLEGTDLAEDYQKGTFQSLTMEEYLDILFTCLQNLPPETIIHRITGDGPKNLLIAPTWSTNKKNVLNPIRREMKQRNIVQGQEYVKTGE